MIALKLKAMLGDDRPLWKILVDLREEKLNEAARLPRDELVGDEAANREVTFALIALEMMMRGETTIPMSAGESGVQHLCAYPGCTQITSALYCLHHELESDEGQE